MIKVVSKKDSIVVIGHADYADYGKDIVCASASAIVITSINACLRINKESIKYKEEKDKLTIDIISKDKDVLLIIENMMSMLEELEKRIRKILK